jgi:NADP-dependent 3-hydroxy acid dehydrogenase YdfG
MKPATQVALLTGASSGIREAIALALAAQGKTIWLVGRVRESWKQLRKWLERQREAFSAFKLT